jgi:NADPH:quinone reductase
LERVKQLTDGKGVDVIYDPVGGDLFKKLISCLAFSGRIIVVGFASGKIPSVETNRILLKNISVVGLHWGAYSIHDPDEMTKMTDECHNLYKKGTSEFSRCILVTFQTDPLDFTPPGAIKPVIFRQYPVEQVSEALKQLSARKTHGKVVLTFDKSNL